MEEASKHGDVVDVVVPAPPRAWEEDTLPRTGLREVCQCRGCIEGKEGVSYPDAERQPHLREERDAGRVHRGRARAPGWIGRKYTMGKVELPGLYVSAGAMYAGGVSGLLVLSPSLGAQIRQDAHAWDIIRSEIIEDEVPLEERMGQGEGVQRGRDQGRACGILEGGATQTCPSWT